MLYMVTWIPSIYPLYVSIYTSTMDPMGYGRSIMIYGYRWYIDEMLPSMGIIQAQIESANCGWLEESPSEIQKSPESSTINLAPRVPLRISEVNPG